MCRLKGICCAVWLKSITLSSPMTWPQWRGSIAGSWFGSKGGCTFTIGSMMGVCVCVCACVCVCVCARARACACVCVCPYIHTYIHIYIHTYVCIYKTYIRIFSM
jgi:hypothetical protein